MQVNDVKFLLVDDLEANLLALEGLLRREGLELHPARSGPQALELLLKHDFALAIVDVQMPGMDGFELAEIMRGTERTRRVPIIFVTAGIVDAQRRFRGYEAGAVDFLFKPIEPHILRTKAGVFFELCRQRNELLANAGEKSRLLAESRQAGEELRLMRDQLAQANRVLEETVRERTAKLRETVGELEHFSYTITHDMRAPLRAMQAFGTLLTMEKAGQLDDEGRDFLRRIVQSAQRMDHLITDALNYGKLLGSHMELRPLDPGALLRGMLESYPELQPGKVAVEITGELPRVLANPAGLTQCFSNLLGNAVKFVKPGLKPRVRIWAERQRRPAHKEGAASQTGGERGWVRFWFEDNGIGIPGDQRERIFQMFQRLDTKQEGTGIGLALVRKAAERMKGAAGVESEPGRGSRFWIDLLAAVD
jgi:signal transduction histidine kinase